MSIKNRISQKKLENRVVKSRLEQRTELRKLVLLAMLFALALVLSWVEGFLPPIPAPVPLKFGLSNIAVMYALFFLNAPSAFLLAILKSSFVLMQRGFLSASLSLGGGVLSVAVMLILSRALRHRISFLILSISGAIFHNIGQFSVLLLYYNVRSIVWIMPYLLVTGIGTGVLSATLLKMLIPALKRVPGGQLNIRTSPTDPVPMPQTSPKNELIEKDSVVNTDQVDDIDSAHLAARRIEEARRAASSEQNNSN